MNKLLFGGLALFAISASALSSCNNDEDEPLPQIKPLNEYFDSYRLSFRFVDGQGKDLIDINDKSTYPVIRPSVISADSLAKIRESINVGDTIYDNGRMMLKKTADGVVATPLLYGSKNCNVDNYIYVCGDTDRVFPRWIFKANEICDENAMLHYYFYNDKGFDAGDLKKQDSYPIVTVIKDNGVTTVKQ